MEQTIPQTPRQVAFASLRESRQLVGDAARSSRAQTDTLKFAAWVKSDIVATSELFAEAWKAELTDFDAQDSYVKSLHTKLKATLFSHKAEVQRIVQQWAEGAYLVGLDRAYSMATGADERQAKVAARKAEAAARAETIAAVAPAPEAVKTPATVKDILALLSDLTSAADLRIVAERAIALANEMSQAQKAA